MLIDVSMGVRLLHSSCGFHNQFVGGSLVFFYCSDDCVMRLDYRLIEGNHCVSYSAWNLVGINPRYTGTHYNTYTMVITACR